MVLSFYSKITSKGNIKVSPQVLDILGADYGDEVRVSVELDDMPGYERGRYDRDCSECFNIPPEILEEAGIDEFGTLEMYVEDGRIIIREADDE